MDDRFVLSRIHRARRAAEEEDWEIALINQQQAVEYLRRAQKWPRLAAQIYNLAGYLQDAGEYQTAVSVLTEVVQIDEQEHLPDLEHDRAVLARAQMLADLSPAERAKLEAESLKYLDLTPEERRQEMAWQIGEGLRTIAEQVTQTAVSMLEQGGDVATLVAGLETAVARIAYDEALGPERADLVAFLRGVIYLLRGQPVNHIPEPFNLCFEQIRVAKR